MYRIRTIFQFINHSSPWPWTLTCCKVISIDNHRRWQTINFRNFFCNFLSFYQIYAICTGSLCHYYHLILHVISHSVWMIINNLELLRFVWNHWKKWRREIFKCTSNVTVLFLGQLYQIFMKQIKIILPFLRLNSYIVRNLVTTLELLLKTWTFTVINCILELWICLVPIL